MRNKIFCLARENNFLAITIFGIKIRIYKKYYALEGEINTLEGKVFALESKINDLEWNFTNFTNFTAKVIYEDNLLTRVKKYELKKPNGTKLKNIISVNTVAKKGGAAKIAYTVANILGKRGLNSVMATSGIHEYEEPHKDEKYIKFLPISSHDEYNVLNYLNNQTGYLDFFYYKSLALKNREEFIKADLLHLHNLHGEYFSYFALPELTALKPTIWTLHDTQSFAGHCGFSLDCNKWESEECINCPYVSLYQSLPFDTANFIYKNKKHIYENMASDTVLVSPSNWVIDNAKKSILRDYDIRLINNGIDNSIYKPYNKADVRDELNLPKDKKILMFACDGGDASPWKGGEYIKEVYETFSSNKDLFFMVIGGGSEKELLNNNYLKVPYISDESLLAKYYSASDLFIYPSKADNHPLAVLEALACGLPVITFNTGGIPEIVEHMKTGYVAEHRNIDDFIKGINIFLSDSNLMEKASILGIEIIKEKFTNKLMVDKYFNLYNEVYEKRLALK